MVKRTLILVAIIAVTGALASNASAGTWKAGTPWMVEESDMQDLLEQTYDWAYCTGIPRFGVKGEWPSEIFVMFDCDVKRDGIYCSGYRVKSIKAKQRGYFKLRFIRDADCY